MVIPISIEFNILPEKPQKDYAGIFKTAVHVEGGDEKVFFKGQNVCSTVLPWTTFHMDVHPLFCSPLSPLSYNHACS